MTSGGTEEFTYERGLKQTYTPPVTESDPDRHQTVYSYFENQDGRPDRIDRLKSVTDALGHTTTYDYNKRGQVTTVKHHDTKYTENSYNPLPDGTRTGPDGTLAWTEDELRHRSDYWYDGYGRVVKVRSSLGKETLSDYTPPGLSPFSHTTASVYRTTSDMGKIVEHDYDRNFRLKRTTLRLTAQTRLPQPHLPMMR